MAKIAPALVLLLSGCNCVGRSEPPPDPHASDGPATGAAVEPVTESYCVGACAAAHAYDCQTMFNRLCKDSDDNYASVGGYILSCRAAMLSACYPNGQPDCRRTCVGASQTRADPDSEGRVR